MSNSETECRKLILFVVGNEHNSCLARQNLSDLCKIIQVRVEIIVIDVLIDFHTALKYNILVTPALVQVNPLPTLTILGNLSHKKQVLETLGLKEEQQG